MTNEGFAVVVSPDGKIARGAQKLDMRFANRIGMLYSRVEEGKKVYYLRFYYRLDGKVDKKNKNNSTKEEFVKITASIGSIRYLEVKNNLTSEKSKKVKELPPNFLEPAFMHWFKNELLLGRKLEEIIKETGFPERNLKSYRLQLIRVIDFNPAQTRSWIKGIRNLCSHRYLNARERRMEDDLVSAAEKIQQGKSLESIYECLSLKGKKSKKIGFRFFIQNLKNRGYL